MPVNDNQDGSQHALSNDFRNLKPPQCDDQGERISSLLAILTIQLFYDFFLKAILLPMITRKDCPLFFAILAYGLRSYYL